MAILNELPQQLRAAIRRHNVPGASIAIYRNGRLTEAAAGVVNVDTRVPTTTDTVFQIGSISKIFTTTLVMQLVDEGLVDLDEPLRGYLPRFRVADGNASNTVTLRQLLCHSSGIEGDLFVDSGRGDDCVARLQVMGRLLPQLFAPGERLSYCNFGFAMLGRMIEVLTGDTWDAAMRKRIFEPLGMNHALTLPEETVKYRCAIGHVPHPKKRGVNMLSPMPWLSQGQKAAGATPTMAVGDLMKFVDMHLNGGVARSGERLLSRSSVRAMQRKQMSLAPAMRVGTNGWGLGWFLGTWSGKKVFGHDGGTVGQYSFLRILPERKLAVALLTNGGDAGGLYEEMFEKTFAHFGRLAMPSPPEPLERIPADADKICGRYENLTGFIEFSRNRQGFVVEVTPKPGLLAGMTLTKSPILFLGRNVARLDTQDKILNRTLFNFEGGDAERPGFAGMGGRLYRRIA